MPMAGFEPGSFRWEAATLPSALYRLVIECMEKYSGRECFLDVWKGVEKGKKPKSQSLSLPSVLASVTRFGNFSPFWQFSEVFGKKKNCPKSPVYTAFIKLVYLLWRQIWRFSQKCWQFFCLNIWSHWSWLDVGTIQPYKSTTTISYSAPITSSATKVFIKSFPLKSNSSTSYCEKLC